MATKKGVRLWYDGSALDAAPFYAKTFPDSAVAKGVFDAMMKMTKVEPTAIEVACRGH